MKTPLDRGAYAKTAQTVGTSTIPTADGPSLCFVQVILPDTKTFLWHNNLL